ncbi:MAG TPA: transcriptional repressor LexA [Gammaproteobacteria bacterium]
MLTQLESRLLSFIQEFIRRHGAGPTMSEIAAGLGLQSRGTVHRYVQSLVDKGLLEHRPGSKRGLRLAEAESESARAPTLPLLGRIAAGRPIEAIPGEDEINLSDFLMGPNRYALRVFGDSMIGAGILDGDTVVVEHCDTARDGAIVVALIDDQEATLKRLRRRSDGGVMLIAENPAMPPMIYAAERVRIQGVVVAQLRSYR